MRSEGTILCPHCQKPVGFAVTVPDPAPVNRCRFPGCDKPALDPWPQLSCCKEHDPGR